MVSSRRTNNDRSHSRTPYSKSQNDNSMFKDDDLQFNPSKMKKDSEFFNENEDMDTTAKIQNFDFADSVDNQEPLKFYKNSDEDMGPADMIGAGLVIGSEREEKDKKGKKKKKDKKEKKKKKKKNKPDPKEQSRFATVFDAKPEPKKKRKENNIFENEYLEDEIDIFGSITMLSKVKPKKRRR